LPYFSYLVECSNGSLYAGWTSDLERRLQQHNSGKGAKYTRALRPVVLRASWEFPSKKEAMSHEWQIKQLSRVHKLRLIDEKADTECAATYQATCKVMAKKEPPKLSGPFSFVPGKTV
jgi:putative endonuclease